MKRHYELCYYNTTDRRGDQCPVCPAYAAYATCAAEFEDTYLNEMGSQRWEMASLSTLEETVPGDQWCRGVTVGHGFEVAWKRIK